MTVERCKAWRTTDGYIFETRREAEEHDAGEKLDEAASTAGVEISCLAMDNEGEAVDENVLERTLRLYARTANGREVLGELIKRGGSRYIPQNDPTEDDDDAEDQD